MRYAEALVPAAQLPSGLGGFNLLTRGALNAIKRSHLVAALAVIVSASLWVLPQELPEQGRLALIILAFSVIGWTMTKIGDTAIAVFAAVGLAATGVIQSNDVFNSLGQEMIWLMIAAFAMSAVLRKSGVIERTIFAVTHRITTVSKLFYVLTGVITATAFVIPSTSGRAALLLPVFLVFAERLKNHVLVRALALLFPTVILLSASGSLIGAGAHIVAAQVLAEKTGLKIGFFEWMLYNLPFALVTSFSATWIIQRVFLSPALREGRLDLKMPAREPLTRQQLAIAGLLVLTIVCWMTEPLHGIGIGLVAVAGAMGMLQVSRSILKTKDAFKAVETELLVFLAATFVIASALTKSGADKWLASGLLEALPEWVVTNNVLVIAVVAAVSLVAHIFVTSRSARAAVLIPAFMLPLAGLGHDLTLLILVTVTGTGFCQTMTASAKPVALYAQIETPSYTNDDLMRLSLALLPMMFFYLMVFGLFVWPAI